mmetsp:Transcript_52448/g.126975  ORF Transcript_52448/g.126975 Transcript_52448/m.126975 type:complete len:456 (-) Transcript_52448:35-1402(-)
MTTSSSSDNTHIVLVEEAKAVYDDNFANTNGQATTIAVAPGRVNLIGEHVDYTGGFVLPFAIHYAAAVYGRGSLTTNTSDSNDTNTTGGSRTAHVEFGSAQKVNEILSFDLDLSTSTPPSTSDQTTWATYVVGTITQYMPDLPPDSHLTLSFGLSGNVPLGSGLSSSAALEVAVARFVEAILGPAAFSSDPTYQEQQSFSPAKSRALRCQKAENEWCHSPCGIMDQAISSAAPKDGGCLLLIDCRSLEFQETVMASTTSPLPPVLVVTNSHVKHDIAGGEYPVRVAQCKKATEGLQQLDGNLVQLRDATIELVETAQEQGLLDELSYKRAKHVVTENQRTVDAKVALEAGDWELVGNLMNASHASMRDDYEVSCEEIDILVDLAQKFDGVYGSRLTGGGFGGCTVTLVAPDKAAGLMEYLKQEYKVKTGTESECFETRPARGAHLLSIKDYQPLV